MAAMNTPLTPDQDTQWGECHRRLSYYLLAHGLDDPGRRHEVATAIIRQAQREHLTDDSISRLATTYAVLEKEMTRWFRTMPALSEIPDQALLVTGRLFWRLGKDGGHGSDHFLGQEDLPGELSNHLAALDSLWPPELSVSVMIPREPPVAQVEPAVPTQTAPWNRTLVVLTTFILAAVALWQLL